MFAGVSSQHLVISETNLEMEDLDEIEKETGLKISQTFDRVVEEKLPDEVEAETELRSGSITLVYEDEISRSTFAHESAHAEMMYPKGDLNIPDENPLNQRIYSEFVAYMSEGLMAPLDISTEQKVRYQVSKSAYNQAVQVAEDKGLSDDLDSMYDCWRHIGDVEDESVRGMLENQFWEHQENREQILTEYAASNYLDNNESQELRSLLNPGKDKYQEILSHIQHQEQELLEGLS